MRRRIYTQLMKLKILISLEIKRSRPTMIELNSLIDAIRRSRNFALFLRQNRGQLVLLRFFNNVLVGKSPIKNVRLVAFGIGGRTHSRNDLPFATIVAKPGVDNAKASGLVCSIPVSPGEPNAICDRSVFARHLRL